MSNCKAPSKYVFTHSAICAISSRRVYVTLSNTVLTCGVPQGSVLGPILFVLYTADVISIIENLSLLPHTYADDTHIYGFCQPDVKVMATSENKFLTVSTLSRLR
jgi:Reverse transcriptase (RNA-dependent DNA polymerase)